MDKWDPIPDCTKITNIDLMRAIRHLFKVSVATVQDRGDKVRSDMERKCAEMDINGHTHRPKIILHVAARVVEGLRKRDHITDTMCRLHWLPVRDRIQFKVHLLTFKALNNLASEYISELLTIYTPSRSLRSTTSWSPKNEQTATGPAHGCTCGGRPEEERSHY